MKLNALTQDMCEQVRQWRNDCLLALRTPYMLTEEQQEDFYQRVVCDRNARARYWAVESSWADETQTICGTFLGMVGLENIEWENGCAEISIMLAPEFRGDGKGEQAVKLLLEQGFNHMRMEEIYGECYTCNPAIKFWQKITEKYNGKTAILPRRKFWQGAKFDAMYFSISREGFIKCRE
jgi:RimJ/RimL family protein N-acetyltransferase